MSACSVSEMADARESGRAELCGAPGGRAGNARHRARQRRPGSCGKACEMTWRLHSSRCIVMASHLCTPPTSGMSCLQLGARRVAVPLSPHGRFASGSIQVPPCSQGALWSLPTGRRKGSCPGTSVTSVQGPAIPLHFSPFLTPERVGWGLGTRLFPSCWVIGFCPPDATEGNGDCGACCPPSEVTAVGALS